MRAEITALVASVEALKVAHAAEIANSAALKARLVEALENGLAPDDIAALAATQADIQAVTQALADSTAVNAPGN